MVSKRLVLVIIVCTCLFYMVVLAVVFLLVNAWMSGYDFTNPLKIAASLFKSFYVYVSNEF